LVVRHAGEDGPIITDTQTELADDAAARAHAERQRLSYVALTRAQHELVIALPAKARAGSLAKTVLELHAEGAFASLPALQELAVSQLLESPKLLAGAPRPGSDPPTPPAEPQSAAIVLGVTALSDFRICPRRFSLVQLHGLSEPRRGGSSSPGEPDEDPRLAGIAAHQVLETWPLERWGTPPDPSELAGALERAGISSSSVTGQKTLAGLSRFLGGSYAALVRRDAVRLERELSLTVALHAVSPSSKGARPPDRRPTPRNPAQLELFAAAVAPAPAQTTPGSALVVKATLDLLVELKDGSIHVIDYKRARGGGSAQARYAPQLSLYRAVVEQHFGKTPRVGLLHLLGDADEPDWLKPEPIDAAALARAFLAARASDEWPHVPEATCRAVHCGFVTSCHGLASSP
jgi:ATP-dependent helicase/nuclease subunit A